MKEHRDMHDFRDDYELDEDGRLRKKKRVLPDGGSMHVPTGFYDGRFRATFADGTPDHTSPHKPGYRFADTDDEARIAANDAYEARSRRMETAWRDKGDVKADAPPPRTQSLDQTRSAADAAYAERNERLRNAWRHD
jgi:hypothetical protein